MKLILETTVLLYSNIFVNIQQDKFKGDELTSGVRVQQQDTSFLGSVHMQLNDKINNSLDETISNSKFSSRSEYQRRKDLIYEEKQMQKQAVANATKEFKTEYKKAYNTVYNANEGNINAKKAINEEYYKK